MADKTEAAKAFMAGVLAKVPEGQRAAVQAAIEASPEALALIGDGVIRQEDYSRNMNDLAAAKKKNEDYYVELSTWHTGVKTELETLRAAKPAPVADPNKPAPDGNKADITKADVDAMLDTFGRDAAGFVAATNTLSMAHFQKFGEVLDLRPLLEDKRIKELGLNGVYNEVYKEQLAAKAAAATAAETARLRAEIETNVRRELANQQIPGAISPQTGASPLDAIGKAPDPAINIVDAAATEYNRLAAARNGATP